MATDIDTLENRYYESCRSHGVLSSKAFLSSLFKAKVKRARHEITSVVVSLDDSKDVDYQPLLDLLMEIDVFEVEAVDIKNRSSCVLSGEHMLSLLCAIHKRLRVVDLQDKLLGKDFFGLIKQGSCIVLAPRFILS